MKSRDTTIRVEGCDLVAGDFVVSGAEELPGHRVMGTWDVEVVMTEDGRLGQTMARNGENRFCKGNFFFVRLPRPPAAFKQVFNEWGEECP